MLHALAHVTGTSLVRMLPLAAALLKLMAYLRNLKRAHPTISEVAGCLVHVGLTCRVGSLKLAGFLTAKLNLF